MTEDHDQPPRPHRPLYRPIMPATISNLLSYLNILLREIKRAEGWETDARVLEDLNRLRLYGSMVKEKINENWEEPDATAF